MDPGGSDGNAQNQFEAGSAGPGAWDGGKSPLERRSDWLYA
jgi:hypothetical protein